MVHPDTEVRFINDAIGYGVFAKRDIPKGTIMYARDGLEIELDQASFHSLDANMQFFADKYGYMDECGILVISWDHAKLVNHSCNCNSMSAAYGIEIAIRDIAGGEEITDEYGMFNVEEEMDLYCCCPDCRKVLRPDDLERYHGEWDTLVQAALNAGRNVDQPLLEYLRPEFREELESFWSGRSDYRSVLQLKCAGLDMNGNPATVSGDKGVG